MQFLSAFLKKELLSSDVVIFWTKIHDAGVKPLFIVIHDPFPDDLPGMRKVPEFLIGQSIPHTTMEAFDHAI
jgi:hypothetical protein